MSLFVVLVAGRLTASARLSRQVEGARAIAANSGIRHASALGLVPELWVGDFNSSDGGDFERWASIPRKQYPADKEVTDSDLAIAEAIERGATSLLMAGAFGGSRADHGFLHITQALALSARAIPILLTSGDEEGIPVVPGKTKPDLAPGVLFSLLPFSDLAALTIEGAKWPLVDRDVPFGSTLTLSNVAEEGLSITLGGGRAFLVAYPKA